MRLFLSASILSLVLFFNHLSGAAFTSVPSSMQQAVDSLLLFPQTRSFIHTVEKEGAITLKWKNLGENSSYAMWYGQNRTIVLNSAKSWTEGKKISSILFELHNAQSNKQLGYLDNLAWRKQISQLNYIESVEKLEYQNVLKTAHLLNQGIELGYFPRNAYMYVHPNFADHYKLQIKMGHSSFIAYRYQQLITQ